MHMHMHLQMQPWFNPPPSYSQDDLERCLYSIGDNDSFLNSNRLPVDTCIALLQQYFHPDSIEDGYSLAIDEGADGCRLTHSHKLQFNYVLQSLTLWRNIIDDLFRLWYGSPDRRVMMEMGSHTAYPCISSTRTNIHPPPSFFDPHTGTWPSKTCCPTSTNTS
jgi:hypothetical protein